MHVACAQPQPVPQAPAGNAVPADNFNRAEADLYFSAIVKDRGIGSLRHGRPAGVQPPSRD